MTRMLEALLVTLLVSAAVPAHAEVAATAASTYISTKINPADRYEIIAAAPFADSNTFRFDRVCGGIDLLVADDRKGWVWKVMDVADPYACIVDGRNHYQFLASGQKDHIFIMNTDNKATWLLDTARMAWVRM